MQVSLRAHRKKNLDTNFDQDLCQIDLLNSMYTAASVLGDKLFFVDIRFS